MDMEYQDALIFLQNIPTQDWTEEDLDMLMSHFGSVGRAYLYGVSYGTQLSLRMLTMGMQSDIDGLILDSLVPLESNTLLDLSHRSMITDLVGRDVLRECDQNPDCRQYFPDGAEDTAGLLVASSDIEELVGDRLKYRLSAMLDFPETREMLPYILADLQAGNTEWLNFATDRLASVASLLEPYPQAGSSIPLVSLINRSENNARRDLTSEKIKDEAEEQIFASPLPSLLLSDGFPTYETDIYFARSPRSIPRTVVLQGTLDPKTPFDGAREHVEVLQAAGDIELVPIKRAPHFILMTAPDAFKRSVHKFLRENGGAP